MTKRSNSVYVNRPKKTSIRNLSAESSIVASEFVAQFLRPRGSVLDRGDQPGFHAARFQRRERTLGGTAFRRDLCAKRGRVRVALLCELHRAGDSGIRETTRVECRESQVARRRLDSFE